MKTELKVRQQAIALHLQGWNKSEIARKVQRSRRWVQAPSACPGGENATGVRSYRQAALSTRPLRLAHARSSIAKGQGDLHSFRPQEWQDYPHCRGQIPHWQKYKWHDVLANVDVAKKKLNILWQGKHIRSFDYH